MVFYLLEGHMKFILPFIFTVNYGFSVLLFTVYFYIFLVYLVFCVLFLYDIKKFKTLNTLQVLSNYGFVSNTITLLFLSFAGVPPLLGFISKFLIFNLLLIFQKIIFLVYFLLLNLFSVYFYAQNLRFLVTKHQLNFFLICVFYFYFNKPLVNVITFGNFFNTSAFLYIEDFLYIHLFTFNTKGLF
jgi:NADH:ubiquinone oxidoreductase subunit 2 (subunit N)